MTVKLLTAHHLEFLSFTGGCRGSFESTHIKMPHCTRLKLLFRSILLKGMSNSIHDASASVFKDIIASPEMEKKNLSSMKLEMVLKRFNSGPSSPNIIYHVTRFGPYEMYLAVGGFIQRPLSTD